MKRLCALAALLAMVATGCAALDLGESVCGDGLEGQSVARRWNEELLDAIRRDTPAPTVHARNLYHVSAAMWDAWAAYSPEDKSLFHDSSVAFDESDREITISYAAYTVLSARYRNAVGASETITALDQELTLQCLDVPTLDGEGISEPAQLGIHIAETILNDNIDDGSLELDGYLDLSYVPSNPALRVAEPGVGSGVVPDSWQPLRLEESVTQNEQAQVQPLQFFIGPHWGSVTPFALKSDEIESGSWGAPPLYSDDPAAFRDAAVEVLEFQRTLDVRARSSADYSPASIGNNPLGSNSGVGHSANPVSGAPYTPNELLVADFGRVVAEFWADGPDSETPPGHWNTVANHVSDDPRQTFEFAGTDPLQRLEWDVKLYLTLNGAMHDAAIAAWGAKRTSDSSRPITAIRYLAELGQSTKPDAPRFHPFGLPIITDQIELVTVETSTGRHDGLAPGTIAVRGWAGHEDLHNGRDEIAWIDATTWVPYQLDTFVTPSFPGYVSGHSAFSRAGAEVLTAFTGTEFFPGGLGEWTVPAGWLRFDDGPSSPVTLQWATYFDAADQAGQSRLYGGIHIASDDIDGRLVGAEVGQQAVRRAFALFD